jgi:hypothetical protein
MTKKLLVVCGAFLAMGLAGCGLLDPTADKDSVDIALDPLPASISANGHAYVVATLDANVEITDIKGTVTKLDGSAATGVTVSNPSAPNEKKVSIKQSPNGSDEVDMPINVASDACNGDYLFTLSVTAGTATSSKSDTFSVSGGKNCDTPTGTAIETVTLNAGANENTTLGSSIDLDAGEVYKMADAASHVSALDLCYAHTVSNIDKLGSPSWAKASAFTFAKNWSNPPEIKFYKTDLTVTQFNAITTKEEIAALWTESKATDQSYEAAKNDVFIVTTTADAIALVLINDQTAGSTGSITIKVAK